MTMKSLLVTSTIIAALASAPAMAEHHEGKGPGGHKPKMFEKIDADGNGSISKSEYQSYAEERANKRFEKMDANSDGSISKDEGKAYHDAKRDKRKERRQERRESKSE